MSEPLSISCPECSAKLKLKDRSKVGKKIACPKCQHAFVVTAPPEDVDELEVLEDDLDDFEAEEEEEDAPASRRGNGVSSRASSVKKPAKKSASQGDGSNAGLIAVLSVALLLVLGGSGWLIMSMQSKPVPVVAAADAEAQAAAPAVTDPNRLDLAYLPANAEMIVLVRPARIFQSPLVKALAGVQLDGVIQRMQAAISLQPADIESVTIGVSGMSTMLQQTGSPNPAAMLQNSKNVLMVIRSTRPVDPSQLKPEQNGAKAAEHQGKAYYQIPSSMPAAGSGGLYFASPTLAVLGEESMVKAAIERGPQAAGRPELQFVDASQDFVIAAVPRDKSTWTSSLPPSGTLSASDTRQLQESLAKSVSGASLGLKLADGVDLQVSLSCTEGTAVAEIQKHLNQFALDGRKQFAEIKGTLPANLGALFEQLLTSLKVAPEGNVVCLTISLPASAQDSLKQAPGEIMMAMMTGGFAKGGAPGRDADEDFGPWQGEEGAPVESTAEPLEGITLRARTRWSMVGEPGGSIDLPGPLELVIEVTGESKDRAMGYGKVQATVVAEPEQTLTRLKTHSGIDAGDNLRDMFVFKEAYSNRRPERLEVVIPFRRPTGPLEKLTSVAGKMKLRVARELKVADLAKAASYSGKTVTLPDFKGVGLKVLKDPDQPALMLGTGKNYTISQIEVRDGAGNVNSDANVSFDDWRGVMVHRVWFQDKVPEDASLRISLLNGIEEFEVPFAFKDLQVGRPSRATAEQRRAGVLTQTENAADLPAGLQLTARARWPQFPEWDENRKEVPRPVQVVLELSGPNAARIVSIGSHDFTAITTNAGDTLKFLRYNDGLYPVKNMMSLNRNEIHFPYPVEGAAFVYAFENPGHPITELTKFEGGFHVIMAKETANVVVDKILTRGGKSISHPGFKTAGVELKVAKQGGNAVNFLITKGKAANFGQMVVLDGQGNRFHSAFSRQDPEKNALFLYVPDEAGKDAGVEFTLNWELEELDIPFQFAHLSIPPHPEKQPVEEPTTPAVPAVVNSPASPGVVPPVVAPPGPIPGLVAPGAAPAIAAPAGTLPPGAPPAIPPAATVAPK